MYLTFIEREMSVENTAVCGIYQGGSAESSPAMPSGIRSVKAPVFDPSQHETQQTQYMTCQVCGMLIT